MATTIIPNGTQFLLYDGGIAIGSSTNHSFSQTMETRPATTKSSEGSEEVLPGMKSSELTLDGFLLFTGTKNYKELVVLKEARTELTLKLSTEVTGDTKWTMQAYITSIELEMPLEDSVTYSVSFKVTGSITPATVT